MGSIQLFPQAHDEDFHGPGVILVLAFPDPLTDLITRKRPAGFTHQDLQNFKFPV
jgi:hypothetical protein